MQLIGTLKNITQNILTDEAEVTFAAGDRREALSLAASYADKKLRIEVKEYREKRSLTANAYYWVLVNKLARALEISAANLHNQMLRRIGKPFLFGGSTIRVALPETEETETLVLEDEHNHLMPTSEVFVDKAGILRRTYMMLSGSHDFDRAEFSRLIGDIVDECKTAGIETLPPDELARMMEAYK